MKKATLISGLLILFIISSCSKSDDAPAQIPITYKSISGTWYFSTFHTIVLGKTIPYTNRKCQIVTIKDYIDFKENNLVYNYFYSEDCTTRSIYGTNGYTLNETTGAIESDQFPFNGVIKSLTANEMIINTNFGTTVPALYPDLSEVYKIVLVRKK